MISAKPSRLSSFRGPILTTHLVPCLLLLGLLVAPLHAATHTVCAKGKADYRSLQAAIDNAADGDVIELCKGTITEAGIEILGRTLTLRGQGRSKTHVQAAPLPGLANDRVFLVDGSVVAFEDLTIRHGRTIDNGIDARSGFGGGLAIFSSAVSLDRCAVQLNIAQGSGGGAIAAELSSLEIRDSKIFGNAAWLDFDDQGDDFVSAGGLGLLGVDLVMERSQVMANITNGNGGAISWLVGTGTISSSTLAYNAATGASFSGLPAGGGAIFGFFNLDAPLQIVNSTISHNGTEGEGGGMLWLRSFVDISSTTIADNTSPSSGGLASDVPGVTLANSIVADNGGGDCSSVLNGLLVAGPNLDSDGTCPGFTLSGADAALGPLRDNGGPTLTRALDPSSAAVDAGDDLACAASPVGNVDQRGTARPQYAACDLGAFELSPID